MIQVSLHITRGRHAARWLLSAIVILLLSGSAFSSGPSATARASSTAAYAPSGSGRHIYLTDEDYSSGQALTACASGYRMASFWEILDVSNLIYDYDHPAAHTKADSGFGPPSTWYGRVQTGAIASGAGTVGTANCAGWTSDESTNDGTFVRLTGAWETAPGDIGPWQAATFGCHLVGPVWCVIDISAIYLPLIARGA